MKTGYLIVNYNDYESTKKLIDNIKDYKSIDKILVVDNKSKEFVECAEDVAMQVAAMNPISATRDDVPQDVIDHEMEIYKAQAAESGKPENIQEQIAMGRMNKFYKEQCLTEQVFWKNSDTTVQKYVDEVASGLGGTIKIKNFTRFQLGE